MHIVVCAKIVPDLDRLTDAGMTVKDDSEIDTGYLPSTINPYDETALEIGLRLREAFDVTAQGSAMSPLLSVITLTGAVSEGSPESERRVAGAERYLKTLFALRFDHALHLLTSRDIRFSPRYVAGMIANASIPPADVILMGEQSLVGNNARTPLELAELLRYRCVTNALAIEVVNTCPIGERPALRIRSMVDNGERLQKVRFPVIISVGTVPGTKLRFPTLRDKRESRSKTIITLTDVESGSTGGVGHRDNDLVSLHVNHTKRSGEQILASQQEEAREAARRILEHLRRVDVTSVSRGSGERG